jgi:hypothetical protein
MYPSVHVSKLANPGIQTPNVIANMSDSEGNVGPAQTSTASALSEKAAIKFDVRNFLSWGDAWDVFARVSFRGSL